MKRFGIGQPAARREDKRFLTGQGAYLDDLPLDGGLMGLSVRSPFAHASFPAIDPAEALALPGVRAVLTAADVAAAGLKGLPCSALLKSRDGSVITVPAYPALADGVARYVGQPVAFVVADTPEQAQAAEEALMIDYEPLPAAADLAGAADGPAVWDHAPENVAFDWQMGAVDDELFRTAAHVARVRVVNNRVMPVTMEPRGAIGRYDAEAGYTIDVGCQGVANMRGMLAAMGFDPDRLRVRCPDVGGGFGMKGFLYPEYPLVLLAAKATGQPVRWTGGRSDSFLGDNHGRDLICEAELAVDGHGHFLGYRVRQEANMGAYFSNYAPAIQTMAPLRVLGGAYAIPAIEARVIGRFTHTAPVDAYRGAGRPEAAYLLERAVHEAARLTGLSQAEIRRRNFATQFPHKTAFGTVYDSGDFRGTLDQALTLADYDGFKQRRRAAEAKGLLAGLGLAYYVECTPSGPTEEVQLTVTEGGRLAVAVGTQSSGQGHETSFAQVLGDKLGIDPDLIDIVQGDTQVKPTGIGTGGSHSLFMAGGALTELAEATIDRACALMAAVDEVPREKLSYADGYVSYEGSNLRKSLFTLHTEALGFTDLPEDLAGGLDLSAAFTQEAITYPNGCHIAEVVLDPETGLVRVTRYTVVDDFGRLVNPKLVEGQVHGGVAQGLGQALMEAARYDEDGQLITGSFMDYGIPRAADMPPVEFMAHEVPCTTNPLGVKGCGEAGTIGALPAITLAALDAVAARGVAHLDMPLTPESVWRALQAAA